MPETPYRNCGDRNHVPDGAGVPGLPSEGRPAAVLKDR